MKSTVLMAAVFDGSPEIFTAVLEEARQRLAGLQVWQSGCPSDVVIENALTLISLEHKVCFQLNSFRCLGHGIGHRVAHSLTSNSVGFIAARVIIQ